MSKFFILGLLLLTPLFSYSQDNIGHKIYSYGQVENSVQGKTIIHYLLNDAKGEVKIIDLFNDFDVDAVSWNKFFMPGYTYTDSEVSDVFTKNGVKTLILVKINDVATTNAGISTTVLATKDAALTYGESHKRVVNVNLSLHIYNYTNGFTKPICVINGEANNFWKGGQRNISTMIIERILKAMKDQKAFQIN
jgi:hypothetical protein